MKKYNVKVEFDDGRIVNSKLFANNDGEAVRRITQNKEYADFAGGSAVKKIDVEELPEEKNIFTPSEFDCFFYDGDKERRGLWYVHDLKTGCVVEFMAGRYNSTAKTKTQPPKPEGMGAEGYAVYVAECLRRISDYMATYRYNLATGQAIEHHKQLGRQFRTLREAMGMTIEDAAMAGQFSSTKTPGRIESGLLMESKFSQVERYAEAIGCHLELVPDSQK